MVLKKGSMGLKGLLKFWVCLKRHADGRGLPSLPLLLKCLIPHGLLGDWSLPLLSSIFFILLCHYQIFLPPIQATFGPKFCRVVCKHIGTFGNKDIFGGAPYYINIFPSRFMGCKA